MYPYIDKIFKLRKEKNKGLTIEDIISLGWEKKETNFPNGSVFTFFSKGNYFLTIYEANEVPVINITVKDICLITWMPDPEKFRVTIKCPTIETFKYITNLLEIDNGKKED